MKLEAKHIERFWKRVSPQPQGCWLWLGATNAKGYGQMRVGSKRHPATHICLVIHQRELPVDCVMHTCDNPSCVNPAHLKVGTYLDNALDASRKGRLGKKGR